MDHTTHNKIVSFIWLLLTTAVGVFLYGKEVNPETYAICKSDMMIKGNDPENILFASTLATNDFSGKRFDFMLTKLVSFVGVMYE